jgi:hypothetical protein
VLVVIACAVTLQWEAEKSRSHALRLLDDEILLAKKSEEWVRLAEQLDFLSRHIEKINDGAFRPYSQQPLIRAMLLPLGSFGGAALLEHFLLPG